MPLEDWEAYARAVRAPTLVMRRRADKLSSAAGAQGLAALVPGAELLTFEGENHLFLPDEPEVETFVRAIVRFVRGEDFVSAVESAVGAEAAPSGFQTILFTDLEASTALTQRLGDEGAQELLRGHNATVRAALGEHGGREVKHTGDGIMAAFPSAVAAVSAALAIQGALASGASDREVRVRVGVNAGEPIAEDGDLFGTAVQLAARVTDHAEPGQILVSNVVRELCAGKGFEFASAGESTLRGFSEPVALFEVRGR